MCFRAMAARRLVILMVGLLVVSTIAAALAPPRNEPAEETTSETTVPAPRESGALVSASLDAGATEPKTIEVTTGDQVSLIVRSPELRQIEIADLGLLQDAAPDSPARFDLLLDSDGSFDVMSLDAEGVGAVVGTIVVAPAEGDSSPAPDGVFTSPRIVAAASQP